VFIFILYSKNVNPDLLFLPTLTKKITIAQFENE